MRTVAKPCVFPLCEERRLTREAVCWHCRDRIEQIRREIALPDKRAKIPLPVLEVFWKTHSQIPLAELRAAVKPGYLEAVMQRLGYEVAPTSSIRRQSAIELAREALQLDPLDVRWCATPWCNALICTKIDRCSDCAKRVRYIRQSLGLKREQIPESILRLLWVPESALSLSDIAKATGRSRDYLRQRRHQLGAGARKGKVRRGVALALIRGILLEEQGVKLGDLARRTGWSVVTLNRWVGQKKLQAWKVGRWWLVPIAVAEQVKPSPEGGIGSVEAAARIGIHPGTLGDWIRDGEVAATVVGGGHYRISEEEVARLAQVAGWLTTEQVAKRLGVSQDTVLEYCRAGLVSAEKLGQRYRVNPEEIKRFREQHRPPRATLSAREFGRRVGLSRLAVVQRCRSGRLRHRIWEGQYRIPTSEVRHFQARIPLKEASDQTGLPYINLRELARKGRLPHERVGERIFVSQEQVEELTWQKENLISAGELARLTGLTKPQVKRLCAQRQIKTVERPLVGKAICVRSSVHEVRAMIERGEIKPARSLGQAA
jgi:excisionase family DNA binding protein